MLSSSCSTDANKCRSQVALNRLLKDPILGPFLKSSQATSSDNDNASKIGGYGWISLPTTAANGTDESKSRLNLNNDVINFLAIKKYKSEDSKIIYNALTESMASGKGTGRNIIFDNHGNFAYWNGTENKIFRNPIIPPSSRKPDGQILAGKAGTGETNATLFNQMSPFITGTNIYYYNNKMIANPKMTYIILTKDAVPSENSIYYLVYNPIHRKKFQEYYTHLLGYEGVWRGNKLVQAGGTKGYQNETVNTVPTPNGGPSLIAPSFINTVARYCNALKIGGDTLSNGRRGEHYADPTCNFILSIDDANLALITGKNHTQSNLAYERYAKVNDDEAQAKAQFTRNRGILLKGPGNAAIHWPCKDSWPKDQRTSLQFAGDLGLFGEGSSSFVNVLGNAYLNSFDTTLTNNNRALNIDGEGFNQEPGCTARNVNITACTNIIDIGGNAEGNDFAMQNACGMERPEPEPQTQQAAEQASTSGPSTGQASTSGPSTGQASTSGPSTGQASTSGPSTGQASTSGPSTGQASTSGPSTGQASTGEVSDNTGTDNTMLYIIIALLAILVLGGMFLF